ncbi:hypothetical protein MsAg5_12430 [Methanosarcinaceae archaeon Ag5]|uniref:Uncharacterized protein n=1 Tax=Methanolapillus africanus TaxID=3028297 RepID=A0AAE4MIV9_9EURY|nr:hypothetical protein [Methanosarcinaceae archaeon Ag5]
MQEKPNKKPIYKRWWFILICIFFLLTLMGMLLGEDDTTSKNNSTGGNNSTSVNNSPVVSPPNSLEEAINKTISECHSKKISAVVNNNLETSDPDDKIVVIRLKGPDNFTKKMIRTGMLLDANRIFSELKKWDEVSEVVILWSLPLTDVYGNTKDSTVLKITLERETMDKINFDNFNYENYALLADYYYEHPVLTN